MLPRPHRVTRGEDFRRVMRHGRRQSSRHVTVYWRRYSSDSPARFGFVVSKAVGNSVRRNLVRRRLRAVAAEQLADVQQGTDVVIRALPGAAQASWATLNTEISEALSKGRA